MVALPVTFTSVFLCRWMVMETVYLWPSRELWGWGIKMLMMIPFIQLNIFRGKWLSSWSRTTRGSGTTNMLHWKPTMAWMRKFPHLGVHWPTSPTVGTSWTRSFGMMRWCSVRWVPCGTCASVFNSKTDEEYWVRHNAVMDHADVNVVFNAGTHYSTTGRSPGPYKGSPLYFVS